MFTRVVRFTDVDPERLSTLLARVEGGGAPEGISISGMQMLHDSEQRTVVVLQRFASKEDLEAGAAVFAAMDSSETPGTRASVDTCEVKVEV